MLFRSVSQSRYQAANKRRRRPRRKRPGRRQRNATNTATSFTPYPKIPQTMNLCLRGRTYETATTTASPLWFRYGLVEFLNLGGSYVDTFLNGGLYKYAVVHAARIHLKAVNVGSEPLILACAPLPYSWVSGSPTLAEILDQPSCVRTTIGSSSGQDKGVVVNSASARKVLGKDYQLAKYQMDITQATSITPISSAEPVWVVAVSSFNGLTAVSFRMEVEVDWNVEFYNLDSF